MKRIRQTEGVKFQYRVSPKKEYTLVVISHPDQELVAKFHARQDLKCTLQPAKVVPFSSIPTRANNRSTPGGVVGSELAASVTGANAHANATS
jgi:hypothetical protein